MSKTRAGATFITCAYWRGCKAIYEGSSYSDARETRQQARREGWLTDQPGGRWIASGRRLRLDYCPEHAGRTSPISGSPDE